MNIKNIKSGNNIPKDINVIIEIPNNKLNIKYEINNDNILVDRFINESVSYPYNYGFINNTLSDDNDCLDALVLIDIPLHIGSIINCKPIGLLSMFDEKGKDNKILSVPNFNVSDKFNNINDIYDLSEETLNKIKVFFINYKNNEKNKWTKVEEFKSKCYAEEEIIYSINKFTKNNKNI